MDNAKTACDLYSASEMYVLYDELGANTASAVRALDAIAPPIATLALRRAADALHDPNCPGCVNDSKYASLSRWLRDRADSIEREAQR